MAVVMLGSPLSAVADDHTWPAGDAERGRAIALSRSQGLCILCHSMPGAAPHESGTVGPDLAGVASRLSAQERRQRLLHPERFNPDTLMPSYGSSSRTGQRVAPSRQNQPLLDAQGLADVLAWMATLR